MARSRLDQVPLTLALVCDSILQLPVVGIVIVPGGPSYIIPLFYVSLPGCLLLFVAGHRAALAGLAKGGEREDRNSMEIQVAISIFVNGFLSVWTR